MKYIKAKIVNGETKIYPSDIDKGFLSCVCAEIISEADTIEELCDEFVGVYGETHTIIVTDISPKEILHNMKSWKVEADIYGAIWTDKGLIYVAKMNDKGELELI